MPGQPSDRIRMPVLNKAVTVVHYANNQLYNVNWLQRITILYCSFAVSCNDQKSSSSENQTFVRDIPTYKSGKVIGDTTYLFKAIRQDSEKLNLSSLKNGFDSLEIRIWLGHSMALKRHIVIIQRTNNGWLGQLVTFALPFKEQNIVGFVEKKSVTPKSGWEKFIKKVELSKLTRLRDEDDLVGYNGCGTDGQPYYFEMATNNQYRFYSYCNVEDNLHNFYEARYVDELCKYLEDEFNFEFTR